MKEMLDKLVLKYETKDFIKNDPIQFAHKYSDKKDCEIASFIASLFAFGRRDAFIKKLNILFSLMQNAPYDFICNYKENEHLLNGFVYRFVKDVDLKAFLYGLNRLYASDNSSLEELFADGKKSGYIHAYVSNYFYSCIEKEHAPNLGFCHLFAKPQNGGAMKRMNMFLRWMIRKGPVDLALWDFMKPCDLLIPLDIHVGNVSRSLGLLNRKANDQKSVIELTKKLREFDPTDPIKYDFALFGAGVNAD